MRYHTGIFLMCAGILTGGREKYCRGAHLYQRAVFLENGLLRSIYPFLAPFVVIGFDTADDNGAQLPGNRWIGAASLAVMALAAAVLIRYSRTPEMKEKKKGLEKREGRPLCRCVYLA